jgi:RND family efflux transporter MFP subunit
MVVSKRNIWFAAIFLLIILAVTWYSLRKDTKPDIHSTDVTASKNHSTHESDTTHSQKKQRKIKYWAAPMDPNYIRNKPGKSPMGMDLVPVYEDEEEVTDEGAIRIDPVTIQNMGVRTTKISSGPLHASIRTTGHVTYNEELVEQVHTKISGWIEKLFVKTTGEKIGKGQKILSIYSPELVATEEEYIQALSYREKVADSSLEDIVKGADTLIESTRKRLLLMDIDMEQIKALEERGIVQREMVLRSPSAGIVIKKQVFEGMKVNPGMELYTIADLSRVWVIASVYEYELPFLKVGQETTVSLPYEPGSVYKGHITFIYPYLSPKTRTVQVRMEFDNPDLKLKPDMYADVIIKTTIADNVLLSPSEAVLRTGYRNVVITYLGNGKFLPKEVEIGPEGEGVVQILSGLSEGETIVTSGQFLIDSESNLREAINKMLEVKDIEETGDNQHDMKKMQDKNMKKHLKDEH